MLVALSVITVKEVTSEPVPEVVGIATSLALSPKTGNLKVFLRMSRNLRCRDLNSTFGCS